MWHDILASCSTHCQPDSLMPVKLVILSAQGPSNIKLGSVAAPKCHKAPDRPLVGITNILDYDILGHVTSP
jgi:hypothetical protein